MRILCLLRLLQIRRALERRHQLRQHDVVRLLDGFEVRQATLDYVEQLGRIELVLRGHRQLAIRHLAHTSSTPERSGMPPDKLVPQLRQRRWPMERQPGRHTALLRGWTVAFAILGLGALLGMMIGLIIPRVGQAMPRRQLEAE